VKQIIADRTFKFWNKIKAWGCALLAATPQAKLMGSANSSLLYFVCKFPCGACSGGLSGEVLMKTEARQGDGFIFPHYEEGRRTILEIISGCFENFLRPANLCHP